MTMIEVTDPVVQVLVQKGFRVALHAYLQPDGRVKVTTVAKHRTGKVMQGWNSEGDAGAAFRDLARRAGIGA